MALVGFAAAAAVAIASEGHVCALAPAAVGDVSAGPRLCLVAVATAAEVAHSKGFRPFAGCATASPGRAAATRTSAAGQETRSTVKLSRGIDAALGRSGRRGSCSSSIDLRRIVVGSGATWPRQGYVNSRHRECHRFGENATTLENGTAIRIYRGKGRTADSASPHWARPLFVHSVLPCVRHLAAASRWHLAVASRLISQPHLGSSRRMSRRHLTAARAARGQAGGA